MDREPSYTLGIRPESQEEERTNYPPEELYKAYERGNLYLPQTDLGIKFALLAGFSSNPPSSFQRFEQSVLSPEQLSKTGNIMSSVHVKRNIPVRAATPEEEKLDQKVGNDGKFLANSESFQNIWKNTAISSALGLLCNFVEYTRIQQGKKRIADELEEERITVGLSDGKIIDLFCAISQENKEIVQLFLTKVAVIQQMLEQLKDDNGALLCTQYRRLFSFAGLSDEERIAAMKERKEASKMLISKICFLLKKEIVEAFPELREFVRKVHFSPEEYMYPAPEFKSE